MSKALRAHTILPVIGILAMILGALAPSAYALYRCDAMAVTARSAPCEHVDADTTAASTPTLQSRCCTSETVSLDRLPSELNRHSESERGPVATSAVAVLPLPAFVTPDAGTTRTYTDSGPPLQLKLCSLLI